MTDVDPIVAGLRARRLKMGIAQWELAHRMGATQSMVSEWERGTQDVRLSTLRRWTKALDQDVVLVGEGRRRNGT